MQNDLHTYVLILNEDGKGAAARIEFKAPDPSRAIWLTEQLSPNRKIEVFEDDKTLGTIKLTGQGFWKVSSTRGALDRQPRPSCLNRDP